VWPSLTGQVSQSGIASKRLGVQRFNYPSGSYGITFLTRSIVQVAKHHFTSNRRRSSGVESVPHSLRQLHGHARLERNFHEVRMQVFIHLCATGGAYTCEKRLLGRSPTRHGIAATRGIRSLIGPENTHVGKRPALCRDLSAVLLVVIRRSMIGRNEMVASGHPLSSTRHGGGRGIRSPPGDSCRQRMEVEYNSASPSFSHGGKDRSGGRTRGNILVDTAMGEKVFFVCRPPRDSSRYCCNAVRRSGGSRRWRTR